MFKKMELSRPRPMLHSVAQTYQLRVVGALVSTPSYLARGDYVPPAIIRPARPAAREVADMLGTWSLGRAHGREVIELIESADPRVTATLRNSLDTAPQRFKPGDAVLKTLASAAPGQTISISIAFERETLNYTLITLSRTAGGPTFDLAATRKPQVAAGGFSFPGAYAQSGGPEAVYHINPVVGSGDRAASSSEQATRESTAEPLSQQAADAFIQAMQEEAPDDAGGEDEIGGGGEGGPDADSDDVTLEFVDDGGSGL